MEKSTIEAEFIMQSLKYVLRMYDLNQACRHII